MKFTAKRVVHKIDLKAHRQQLESAERELLRIRQDILDKAERDGYDVVEVQDEIQLVKKPGV